MADKLKMKMRKQKSKTYQVANKINLENVCQMIKYYWVDLILSD